MLEHTLLLGLGHRTFLYRDNKTPWAPTQSFFHHKTHSLIHPTTLLIGLRLHHPMGYRTHVPFYRGLGQ